MFWFFENFEKKDVMHGTRNRRSVFMLCKERKHKEEEEGNKRSSCCCGRKRVLYRGRSESYYLMFDVVCQKEEEK